MFLVCLLLLDYWSIKPCLTFHMMSLSMAGTKSRSTNVQTRNLPPSYHTSQQVPMHGSQFEPGFNYGPSIGNGFGHGGYQGQGGYGGKEFGRGYSGLGGGRTPGGNCNDGQQRIDIPQQSIDGIQQSNDGVGGWPARPSVANFYPPPTNPRSLRETICTEPYQPGSCTAAVRRFWYNQQIGICEQFVFSGCRGNNNNFNTYESCMAICRGPNVPPIRSPPGGQPGYGPQPGYGSQPPPSSPPLQPSPTGFDTPQTPVEDEQNGFGGGSNWAGNPGFSGSPGLGGNNSPGFDGSTGGSGGGFGDGGSAQGCNLRGQNCPACAYELESGTCTNRIRR